MEWFGRILSSPALLALAEKVRPGGHHASRAVQGSAVGVLAGALLRLGERPVLLVVAHLDEAADAVEELRDLGVEARIFPAMEAAAADSAGGLETALERLRASDPEPFVGVTVAPVAALMQSVAAPSRRGRLRLPVRVGARRAPGVLAEWLAAAG